MATILRKLPIFGEPYKVTLASAISVEIKTDQIIVWVSVTRPGLADFPADAPGFPAVFDTGFNNTFMVSEGQLQDWAGLKAKDMTWIGLLRADGQPIPLRDADLWIHRNKPRSRELAAGARPFRVSLPEGVAVWPSAIPGARRLPLLGTRALRRAGVQVYLDYHNGLLSMNTRRWFWFLG